MLQYTKKVKKDRVARMQPPYPLSQSAFEKIASASEVIKKRHSELHSWEKLSRELGGVNKGTLKGIADGKRKPTRKMVDTLNHFYGCRVPYPPVEVSPCAKCGQLHAFSRRCPGSFIKYAPHPVMRVSKIRRLLQNPYLKDS